MGCMIGCLVLGVFLILGFAFLVWVAAAKESGTTKLLGQIIAVVIVVLAILSLLFGLKYGGKMKHGMGMWQMREKGKMMMMDQKMMMHEKMMKECPVKILK